MLTGGWEGGQADYARVVFGALPAVLCACMTG
jgi:hypothetical protein